MHDLINFIENQDDILSYEILKTEKKIKSCITFPTDHISSDSPEAIDTIKNPNYDIDAVSFYA